MKANSMVPSQDRAGFVALKNPATPPELDFKTLFEAALVCTSWWLRTCASCRYRRLSARHHDQAAAVARSHCDVGTLKEVPHVRAPHVAKMAAGRDRDGAGPAGGGRAVARQRQPER